MSGLELTLLLLFTSVLGVGVFRKIHLPPILGYLVVGVIIGPHALGWVRASQSSTHLAEFGVVFLMFSIGLEFNLAKLKSMRRTVFGLGFAQVMITMFLVWLIVLSTQNFYPISWQATIALGGALAMSSTAIVSKLLTERLELESPHGRRVIGVLLFQDLAVVPLLIVVPALGARPEEMLITLTIAAFKAAAVLLFLLVFGQRLMRLWLRIVAERRSQELFMLNLLLITLGLAWLTQLAGLSLALGAFVAGILIAETKYRHQVEENIKPFRDVLLGLFFITIGMQLDGQLVFEHFWLVLGLFLGLLLGKFSLVVFLTQMLRESMGVALRTALYLAPAGEFAFVILNQASQLQLLDPLLEQAILAAMLLSMLAAPFLIQYSNQIVLRLSKQEWMLQSLALHKIATQVMTTEKHVVICGYGRSGQHLARLLEQESISYVALDLDPDRVREATAAGESVVYGDAGRKAALIAAGLARAAAVVITFAYPPAALRVLHHVRHLAPNLPVIVRTHDDSELDKLQQAGATEVVPEIIEGSLMLASHALVLLGIPIYRVIKRIREVRDARYGLLRGFFHGVDDVHDTPDHEATRLHSVTLPAGAQVIGKRLGDLKLKNLEITSLRQADYRSRSPDPEVILQQGDTLVLRGSAEAITAAEQRLLS